MKKVSLLVLLVLTTLGVFAQDHQPIQGYTNQPGRKVTFKRNGFWDNWFLGAGAGANIYFGGNDQHASFFGSRPTVTVNGQLGKWFNPYLGVRGQGTWGSLHSFIGEKDNLSMVHQKLFTVQGDVLFDVTNYLGKYSPDRFYRFIVFGGVGGAWAYDANMHDQDLGRHKRNVTVNAGIINKFRLASRLSLDLEIGGTLVSSDFNQFDGGNWRYNGILNTSLGLTYNFGKYEFEGAVLRDQSEIDQMNDELNRLRQRVSTLEKRPEFCPECPKIVDTPKLVDKAPFVSNVVFFKINSAVINKDQEISIYNTAQYLKENPTAKVKVVGYADKKTGTASYNEKISERRAKAVANALINTYGISKDRVAVEWKGDSVQPYSQNAWNRVAIFYAD